MAHPSDRQPLLSDRNQGVGPMCAPASASLKGFSVDTRFLQVAGSVVVYWLFVSLIPIYNKYFVFRETNFPFPLATAGIQLGVVTLILGVGNVLHHYYLVVNYGTKRSIASVAATVPQPSISWIGGPHFWWKMQFCAPIGILFGLKYGITNWGLHLVSAPTHLLLQATDLVWTVLCAWIINRERLNRIEILCLMGCVAGSFILSWHQLHRHHLENTSHSQSSTLMSSSQRQQEEQDEAEALISMHRHDLFGIFINLLSPILLGLCIATLRWACCGLMHPDNRVGGTVSAVELTTIKLTISSVVALLLAMFFERGGNGDDADSWWHSFSELSLQTQLGVTVGGAILIAVFQVNCTWLAHLTDAVSVGLVGQVKIIPQWFAAVAAASLIAPHTNHNDMRSLSAVGALLIMTSAAMFAGSKFRSAPAPEHGDDRLPYHTNSTSGERQSLLGS